MDTTGRVLINIELKIPSCGIYALVGMGGSGKSLLMRSLVGKLGESLFVSHQQLEIPQTILYLPQSENKYVRFPSNLESNYQEFLSKSKSFLQSKSLFLLDEPDFKEDIIQLVQAVKTTDSCLIFSSHNRQYIQDYADQVITMSDGTIVSVGTSSNLFNTIF